MSGRAPLHRQRGSVLLNAGAGLLALVVLLGVLDLGFLFYYKREYQKAADLSALAGAQRLVNGCTAALAAATANVEQNLMGFRNEGSRFQCGRWDPRSTPIFTPGAANPNAVEAIVIGRAPRFFLSGRQLSADAIARAEDRLAALSIRSTLADLDTNESVLNQLFGGLLGGSVSLSAASWEGLIDTDVQLLNYLDALALRLGLEAGDYERVLSTQASVGTLLGAAVDALEQDGGTGEIDAAIGGFQALIAAIPAGTPLLSLGELLDVQSGTRLSGLDLGLQAFQLAQAFVQAANGKNAAVATVDLGVVTIRLKVIEPPQLSAVGDPLLAAQDPDGPNQIYVRTAQVRSVVSVNLGVLSGVTGLLNAVLNLAAPVTTLLNDVLRMNLVSIVGSLLGTSEVTDIQLVPGNPRIDVSLDAGSGNARVDGVNCQTPGTPTLGTEVRTNVADLRVGQVELDPARPGYIFATGTTPVVNPVPLVDVGIKTCRVFLLVASTCAARRPFAGGGLGLKTESGVAGSSYSFDFVDPPRLDEAPEYEAFESRNIVSSLASTLSGVQLQLYDPQSGGGLGGMLDLVGAAFNTVKGIVQPLVTQALGVILNPLVDFLLDTLGLDLGKVEVSGQLSCGGAAILVE